ncbi:MAG TPA: PaaX family transcriptional regulator C-terminal domain-containing protein [Egicoccus sp.]|nr:PaaX family transcriptional regulator C-terminal domain-containing protein [Egicoccus sp.]HSK22970.1 PaaX family transcriptional regulator C-terminal domain-containing protein [Egicoccus sp.]
MTDLFAAGLANNEVPAGAGSPPVGSRLGRARAQRLLVTLLGDYGRASRDPIPSAALVRILEEFGIAAANARATLSRLTQRGLLERTKVGRRTSYAPTEQALRLLERGGQRIFSLDDGAAWDGTWTLIAFSVPVDDGDLRRLLRARLRWLTFWPLFDATWVTPHDRADAVREQLVELDFADALVLRTTDLELLPGGMARLHEAWQLDALGDAYADYLLTYQPLHRRAAAGTVPPEEALVQRTELVDDWRRLIRDDPDLPARFLPPDFPRAQAREVFLATYAALARPAGERFAHLVRAGA